MDLQMESFDEKHFIRYGNGQLLNILLLKSCSRKTLLSKVEDEEEVEDEQENEYEFDSLEQEE